MSIPGPNTNLTGIPGIVSGTTYMVNHTYKGNPVSSIQAQGRGTRNIPTWTTSGPRLQAIVTYVDNQGQELIRILGDGTVVWPNGIQIDEAARAFEESISLGLEQKLAILVSTKQKLRDSVFEEIIKLVKETDSISVEELTRYWEAAKIIDKLKGIDE